VPREGGPGRGKIQVEQKTGPKDACALASNPVKRKGKKIGGGAYQPGEGGKNVHSTVRLRGRNASDAVGAAPDEKKKK